MKLKAIILIFVAALIVGCGPEAPAPAPSAQPAEESVEIEAGEETTEGSELSVTTSEEAEESYPPKQSEEYPAPPLHCIVCSFLWH